MFLNLKFKRWRTFDFVKKKIFLNFNTLQLQRCDLFISKLCIFLFIATNTFKAKCFFFSVFRLSQWLSFYFGPVFRLDFSYQHFCRRCFTVWEALLFIIDSMDFGASFYQNLQFYGCLNITSFFYSTNVLRLWQPLYTKSFFLFVQLDFGKNGGLFHSWKSIHKNFVWKNALNSPNESLHGSILREGINSKFQRKNHRRIGGVLEIWKLFG